MAKSRVTPRVLGGLTSQDWPVVIEVSRDGKTVTRAVAGLDADAADHGLSRPDEFQRLSVKGGRFRMDWGPVTTDLGDGTTADSSGSITGKFSANRAKVSGTWTFHVVFKDSAGTVLCTHDTGTITWSARQ